MKPIILDNSNNNIVIIYPYLSEIAIIILKSTFFKYFCKLHSVVS